MFFPQMSINVGEWTFLDVVLCTFFKTSSHSLSTATFASGIHIAWSSHTPSVFVCTPETRWADIRSLYFFLPRSTLESISHSPGFRVTRRNVPQIRCVARRNNMRQLSPSKKLKKLSFRSFHWNEFVNQVVILHKIPSFPCNINTNEFCFRHFGSG